MKNGYDMLGFNHIIPGWMKMIVSIGKIKLRS